jgi:hypothetical protein
MIRFLLPVNNLFSLHHEVPVSIIAALKDAELSCTAVSGTAIGMISLPQAPMKMK